MDSDIRTHKWYQGIFIIKQAMPCETLCGGKNGEQGRKHRQFKLAEHLVQLNNNFVDYSSFTKVKRHFAGSGYTAVCNNLL